MDDIRAAAVAAAKAMIGVPYAHQGRNPTAGVDCIGLILCAYAAAGVMADIPSNYSRKPQPELIYGHLLAHTTQVDADELLPGDILVMRLLHLPQHLCLYAGDGQIIHSYEATRQVVAHPLSEFYSRRILSCHRVNNVLPSSISAQAS